jgi:type IV pilus assembly protein PilM
MAITCARSNTLAANAELRRLSRPGGVQPSWTRVQCGLDTLNPSGISADQRTMGITSGKTLVGVDIEPGYVAAVQSTCGGAVVERAAIASLAPGVVREGEVADIDTLASVLHDLFRDNKLPRRVRLGVANQRIVMRTLDLPPLTSAKDIASAVRFQAQEQIPMPLDQAVLDHQTLGTVETPDGLRTRVVLVAARRDMINSLLGAVRKAGLRPEGIDISAFAMIRALHRPGDIATTLYLSIGGVSNLAVAVGSRCAFTRVVAYGTEAMAGEIAERRGLTLEHAHGWLSHVGLLMPLDDVEGDPEIVAEARSVLAEGRRRIADEVRNSLDFYRMQEGAADIERIVLTGPVLAIPGFSDQLGSELELPINAGVVQEARPGAFGSVDPWRLAVAAGLTTTEVAA